MITVLRYLTDRTSGIGAPLQEIQGEELQMLHNAVVQLIQYFGKYLHGRAPRVVMQTLIFCSYARLPK